MGYWADPATRKTPTQVSGLVFWLDAQRLTGLSNTDPVSTFTEYISGNSPTGSGTTRPTYSTAAFDGLPSVKFDGVDDEMYSPSVGMTAVDDFMMAVVAQNNDSSSQRHLAICNGVAAGSGYAISLRVDNTDYVGWLRCGIDWIATNQGYGPTNRQIVVLYRTAGTWGFRVNGVTSTTYPGFAVPTPGAPSTPASYVSLGNIALSGYDWNGYFGEAVMYNQAVSLADIAALEAGWSDKWNTPIMKQE